MAKKQAASKRKQARKSAVDVKPSVSPRRFSRRQVTMALGGVAAVAVGAVVVPRLWGSGQAMAEEVVVYKDPYCGCCGQWIKHMRRSGFEVTVNNVDDVAPIKMQAGIPGGMDSCHTAFIAGYVVEGHVPAEDIKRMLAERPGIKGLVVPGMPQSAPGMDSSDHEPYTVYSFDGKSAPKVYASY